MTKLAGERNLQGVGSVGVSWVVQNPNGHNGPRGHNGMITVTANDDGSTTSRTYTFDADRSVMVLTRTSSTPSPGSGP